MADIGQLKVQCFRGESAVPIDNCRVTINPTTSDQVQNINALGNKTTSPNNPSASNINTTLLTDSSGLTQVIDLSAPPLDYSQEPTNNVPYSLYDVLVERDGFSPVSIRGVQVFPQSTALQKVSLQENANRSSRAEIIIIQPNTLIGNFPAKIPESPDKPLPPPTGGVVLPKPVVPEFITVHQGSPNDASAPNYRVPYKDYIKNVASCEIYSTWPESTIRANVFCIISFTLNRIYTEWYRGKGKNFDITSSTAYDHAFNYGRNIYDSISAIVDEIFSTYIRRFGRKQPLLTQYCDGKNVTCPQWLSQWGSKYLGDQGYIPYDILTYYYGNDIELTTAEQVSGSPSSYPGFDLTVGSNGESVRQIQEFLNRIAQNYPLIPKVAVDGTYGESTAEAVRVFQGIFNLPKTGVVDYATWYRISDIYVGVTRIAELRSENIFYPPNSREMSRGSNSAPFFNYPN
ncbi:peptidoglycan-binding domain-containing protein [Clostridium paraputrificum]|uniref:peptidoglycan-binding domain-containing protein n=1 Tax=Clostridium paraputrificum TaxID=29363 RepID=UPI00189D74DE|nr:peptidoglycan-binding domain-containing protein [Clostridium paraputrificum]MDB2093983.1 peptidoglycan-binding domain-containing protein [Clostridium paraputrificum]MDB2107471.1 peptidoglycan-binding domain-containing protein [Clostridium paraputrificum]MDB2114230.1 peptidoglycan-binding domain-containing protein [Clostridium paraputrificum]